MGKGRDGTENGSPSRGPIFDYGSRPFLSRDGLSISVPVPFRPGTDFQFRFPSRDGLPISVPDPGRMLNFL